MPLALQLPAARAFPAACRLHRPPRAMRRTSRNPLPLRASSGDFSLRDYEEAVVAEVKATEKYGHIVLLRLKDTQSLLPVYIGEFECAALVNQIHNKQMARPLTHDLMKNVLEVLGFRITKVRITALVGNTYHARVHLSRGRGIKSSSAQLPGDVPPALEVDVDARPSDAINLAVRFGAAIYVNKEVAAKMGHPVTSYQEGPTNGGSGSGEHQAEVVRSCREEILAYSDPTIMHKLHLQLAIAEERFEDAKQLQSQIDEILSSDRAISLVVAMETALEDGRYDEAARLRDEFKALRKAQQLSSSPSEVSPDHL